MKQREFREKKSKNLKNSTFTNKGIAILAATFVLVNAGIAGVAIGIRKTTEDAIATKDTKEISVGEAQSLFEGKLKNAGLTYEQASYFQVKQESGGDFYFQIKEIEDNRIANIIRTKLSQVKEIFQSISDLGNKIDSTKIDVAVASTNEFITQKFGASAKPIELQLLHFSDVDGGGDIYNSVKNFSALVTKFKSEYENTLFLSSGDNWIPGPEYDIAADTSDEVKAELGVPGAGRGHIKILNEMGVQASALGNHEFDRGPGPVADVIKTDGAWGGASFPYLATNLDFSTLSGSGGDYEGVIAEGGGKATDLANKVTSYTVLETGGEKFGVIGAVTNALGNITSLGDVRVTTSSINSLVSDIQKDVDALKAEGINKIILLAHMQQISIEEELAPLLDGVDIIVAGGSNTILADSNDELNAGDSSSGNYPLMFEGKDGGKTLVVNTDGDFSYLGRLVVKFDENGFIMPDTIDPNISGAYRTEFDINSNKYGVTPSDINPEVERTADLLRSKVQQKRGVILGRTSVYLNGEREFVRTQETNYGNLTADANLWYAKKVIPEVTLSFKNGGGIRGPIGTCVLPPGSIDPADLVCSPPVQDSTIPGSVNGGISQLDIESSLRFNNGLSVVDLSPSGIKALLETGVSRANINNGIVEQTGSFPQIAGMVVEYDLRQNSGSRIRKITINDSQPTVDGDQPLVIVENGSVVDATKNNVYKMVSLDYVLRNNNSPTKVALKGNANLPDNALFEKGGEQAAIAEYLTMFHNTDATAFGLTDDRFDKTHQDSRLINITPDTPLVVEKKIFGYTNVYLNGDRGDFSTRETNLGDLYTDAHVAYAKKVDPEVNIAIKNSAGSRVSGTEFPGSCETGTCLPPADGELVQDFVEKLSNFNNGLYILELTSQQLVNLLKNDLNRGNVGLQVSGIKMEIDFSSAIPDDGEFLRKVTIIDSDPNTLGDQNLVIWENGAIVAAEESKTFKIVTNSFIATASGYPIAALNLGDKAVDLKTVNTIQDGLDTTFEKGSSRDSIAEYLKENFGTEATAYNVVDTKGDSSPFVPSRIIITK